MASPRVFFWARFAVSAILLAGLLYVIPGRQLAAAVARVSPAVLLSTLAVLMLGHAAAAVKWRLLQGGNTGLTLAAALRAHFYGVFANLWLPGVVGGDVVRAGVIYRETSQPTLVLLASLVDRVVDSASLLALAAAGVVLFGPPSGNAWRVLAAAIGVGGGFATLALAAYRMGKARAPQHPRIRALVQAADLIARRPALVAAAFAISLCIQTAFILVNVQLGRAVGMAAPISAWFLAWPLAKLAALIPVSAAGLGVREAALIALMRPFGDPAEIIMAAGLLWQAVFIAGGILGVSFFLLVPERTHRPAERVASAASEW
jgi:glycosyltransferase 2 family protein